jgi:L-alanine-DL-glutamate epimerase-like enolase superfamily enzyme
MKITNVHSWLVEIPQQPPIAPYQSRYRAQSSKESLLFRIDTDEGVFGWGETPQSWIEGQPFDGTEATRFLNQIRGWDPFDIERLYMDGNLDGGSLQSGIEMALWDIVGKVVGRPLYQLLGGAVRSKEIELAACMGIQPYDRAGELARYYVEQGFSTLKTKAGRRPEEDLEMVRGVRDAVGDRLKLRIDPNMGYPPDTALQLAKDLEPYRLEYFEQPMPSHELEAAAEIRRRTKTPIGLNESVTTLPQVLKIVNLRAADVLLPDTYQCGGILGVKKAAVLADAAGLPSVMHCAHDLGPKTAAMLHIVASSPGFTLANDCTYYGLTDDVLTNPFRIERGRMRVPEGPGLGIEVSLEKVRRYARGSSSAPSAVP